MNPAIEIANIKVSFPRVVHVPFTAVAGGICLGIIENLGITVASASFRDIFAFIFLLLILLFKPEGFARKKGARP